MKLPRFQIAWIMLTVAMTALDLGAIRAVSDLESRSLFLLGVVAIPMANILAVGLLIAFVRPWARDFLKGFVLFGAMALIGFMLAATQAESLVQFYLVPPMALFQATIGQPPAITQGWPTYELLVGFGFLSLWATWPQLAFALMGGLLCHRDGNSGRFD